MKPYTKEELSRILGEHDAGQMLDGGACGWIKEGAGPVGCIEQVAENLDLMEELPSQYDRVGWFNGHYDKSWTVDEFLTRILEATS